MQQEKIGVVNLAVGGLIYQISSSMETPHMAPENCICWRRNTEKASTSRQLFSKTRFGSSMHLPSRGVSTSHHHCAIAIGHRTWPLNVKRLELNLNWCSKGLHQLLLHQLKFHYTNLLLHQFFPTPIYINLCNCRF